MDEQRHQPQAGRTSIRSLLRVVLPVCGGLSALLLFAGTAQATDPLGGVTDGGSEVTDGVVEAAEPVVEATESMTEPVSEATDETTDVVDSTVDSNVVPVTEGQAEPTATVSLSTEPVAAAVTVATEPVAAAVTVASDPVAAAVSAASEPVAAAVAVVTQPVETVVAVDSQPLQTTIAVAGDSGPITIPSVGVDVSVQTTVPALDPQPLAPVELPYLPSPGRPLVSADGLELPGATGPARAALPANLLEATSEVTDTGGTAVRPAAAAPIIQRGSHLPADTGAFGGVRGMLEAVVSTTQSLASAGSGLAGAAALLLLMVLVPPRLAWRLITATASMRPAGYVSPLQLPG